MFLSGLFLSLWFSFFQGELCMGSVHTLETKSSNLGGAFSLKPPQLPVFVLWLSLSLRPQLIYLAQLADIQASLVSVTVAPTLPPVRTTDMCLCAHDGTWILGLWVSSLCLCSQHATKWGISPDVFNAFFVINFPICFVWLIFQRNISILIIKCKTIEGRNAIHKRQL